MGRFTMAAKHHQSIAEMYENEALDLVGILSLSLKFVNLVLTIIILW